MKRDFLFVLFWVSCNFLYAITPSNQFLTIGNDTGSETAYPEGTPPYMFATFDAAGYSDDGIYYGYSHLHKYSLHELLSGEWAAAIYYDDIETDAVDPNVPSFKQSMWLTDLFVYPNWSTNSDFSIYSTPSDWSDPNNPTPLDDTGRSIIKNGRVEIKIDYEVVDLGEVVDEGNGGSPMSFWEYDPNDPYNPNAGKHFFVWSDRYIILQTYTVKNIDPNESTLENIEFYQMLHGHPADSYDDDVTTTYDDADYWKDSLADYVPYNPIHCAKGSDTVGDFRFDITQWNDGNPETTHVDWVGFSSVVEPNWIDSGFYIGGHDYNIYKPTRPGTHWNIEDRNLNNKHREYGEVAGAMGWSLGSLDPNETVSHTIAIMFSPGPKRNKPDIDPAFSLSKTDDVVDCASPCGEEITYTIGYRYLYNNPLVLALTYAPADAEDVTLIDYLPDEVDFKYADPNSGYYDASQHAYIWYVGDVSGGDSDEVDLIVETNDKVVPGGEIENKLVVNFTYSGLSYSQEITHITDICECGDCTDIVYVDKDATSGNNNGTSWANAYLKLQDALANSDMCNQIWVAEGTYSLSVDPNEAHTYNMVNGVGVYGGFDASELELYERDWMANDTILDGFDDPNYVDYVVTADPNTRWALLDGFIIKNGEVAGIFIDNGASIQIEHNRVENNGIGVIGENANTPLIRNNWIYDNTIGIYFEESETEALVFNNTIAENSRGIHTESGTEPNIINCIFWDQTYDANDMIGCYATYSCIEFPLYEYDISDPNNPILLGIVGEGNIDDNPLFSTATNDFHLTSSSPCIDAGDPNRTYETQRDIDKEFRILNGRIDMGADEYCDSSDTTDSDFNNDEIVNLEDFAEFAAAWLTSSTDPNYNSDCDIVSDNEIDLDDFVAFVEDWLWISCSKMTEMLLEGEQDMGISSMQSMSMEMLSMSLETESSSAALSPVITQEALLEKVIETEETIITLETIWAEDEEIKAVIDRQVWNNFMDAVYKHYYGLTDQLEMKWYESNID